MKKHLTLICALLIAFFVIAGFVFGANRMGLNLPQLPGAEAPELTGLKGWRDVVLKVSSVSITPEYRRALPRDADLDQKAFTPGRIALGMFSFGKLESKSDQPTIKVQIIAMPVVELQNTLSNPRLLRGNLYLETGNEMIDSPSDFGFGNRPDRNRSTVLKSETVRLSPSKLQEKLSVQSSYYDEKNQLIPFVSDFEITFQAGSNSRTFVRLEQNQYGMDKALWKRVVFEGEVAVRGKRP